MAYPNEAPATIEYLYAPGWNAANSALSTPPRQPRSTTPMPARRTMAADMSLYEEGAKRTEWEFRVLSATDYNTILSDLNLTAGTPSAKVTIKTRKEDDTFGKFNAIVARPETGRDKRWAVNAWRDVVFRYFDLQEL